MDNFLEDLFKSYKFLEFKNNFIIKGKLPPPLMNEVYDLVAEGYKDKTHPLSFLKSSPNFAHTFSFICPLNPTIFNNSFLFAFLNRVGGYFLNRIKNPIPSIEYYNKVRLRKYSHAQIGDWDIWINFASKSHKSKPHAHKGTLSGIIYVQNTETTPTCFENGYKHYGKPGEILLFPSNLVHWVESIDNEKERITIAFNIEDNNE